MAWFMKGVQSAVFHYASCAPCTGYNERRRRRRAVKVAMQEQSQRELEQPDVYHHPAPTGTNPYWDEELALGPGPPPRRARKNTGPIRPITTAAAQSSIPSKVASSIDSEQGGALRLSDETWNHKRYQREDELLWGHEEEDMTLDNASFYQQRPSTPKSARSYAAIRATPIDEIHSPIVSLPLPNPTDNHWMLQPPPRATIMAGKERATSRSRASSGASNRTEARLRKRLSTKQMQYKLGRGETPEIPSLSRESSRTRPMPRQRPERASNASTRPPTSGSLKVRKRDDATGSPPEVASAQQPIETSQASCTRPTRRGLSTVLSSGSDVNDSTSSLDDEHKTLVGTSQNNLVLSENLHPVSCRFSSSYHSPYLDTYRMPVSTSDVSSLNCLQELVSPRALLQSRFVSAPLVEAKIRLPPSQDNLQFKNQERHGSRLENNPSKPGHLPHEISLDKFLIYRWSADF